MTSGLDWQADYKYPARALARPEDVTRHQGDLRSFRRRREQATLYAVQRGSAGLKDIGPYLLRWAADTRSLRIAWDYLSTYGGSAPGPNDLTYGSLGSKSKWELMRHLSQRIKDGSYVPGKNRRVKIPKGRGPETRDLTLINIEDRVVQRAIVDTIQPIIDRTFDERSYGYRPNRGRWHAWADALAIQQREHRHWWLVMDIKDAFPSVPLPRLLDVLKRRLPSADGLLDLIERSIRQERQRKGLLQGAPLSPLLLNVYLDHFLDRTWRKRHPKTPLLRTADDILILCTTEKETIMARQALEEILAPAGMLLKRSPKTGIRNVRNEQAEWLGFGMQLKGGKPCIFLTNNSLDQLHIKLSLAHHEPRTIRRAAAILRGWINEIGPCYSYEDRDEVLSCFVRTAKDLALEEICSPSENLLGQWSASHARWSRLRKRRMHMMKCEPTKQTIANSGDGDGFADPCDFSADSGRDGRASELGAPPSFSYQDAIVVHTDGCSLDGQRGPGGWAYVKHDDGLESRLKRSGCLIDTTNNRAELWAVIKALESIEEPSSIRLHTDSKYVFDGITKYLPGWTSRSGSGRKSLKNADLWQRLHATAERHSLKVKWIRSHSGNLLNELCDRLAYKAALKASCSVKRGFAALSAVANGDLRESN